MTVRRGHGDEGSWAAGLPAVVRAGEIAFVGARLPGDAPGAAKGVAGEDLRAATELALDAVEAALATVGGTLDDLVGVTSLHSDAREIDAVLDAAVPRLGADPPAWTPIVAAGLPRPDEPLALAAVAQLGPGPKRAVVPDTIAWWRGLGVAAGCRRGGLAVVAGQYGSDADGNVNTPGDDGGQARNALNRVKEICALLAIGLEEVVDLLSLHQDPRGVDAMTPVLTDEALAGIPLPRRPPWLAAGVPALLRFGMLGQYRALASPDGALATVDGRVPAELATADTPAQLAGALDALEAGLTAGGLSLSDVAALETFHVDVRDLPAATAAIRDRWGEHAPAWTPIGVTGLRELGPVHAFRALAVTRPG